MEVLRIQHFLNNQLRDGGEGVRLKYQLHSTPQ
jgi:hypothetical protein